MLRGLAPVIERALEVAVSELPTLARGHDTGLEYHRRLLDDAQRVTAYERALRRLVRPGMTVLDLGAGSGLLAMLAARLGARVHAVESMPIAGLAAELIAANGLTGQVTLHRRDILTMPVVEPVDLLVSDFMGRFLVDDGMLPAVAAALAWLRPEGRCCPGRLRLFLAPVADLYLRAVDLFSERLLGLDLSPGLPHALQTCYFAQLGSAAPASEPALYTELEVADLGRPPVFDASLGFTFSRGGRLQGLAGWFEAELAPGVRLATAPGSETHWGQYLFPLAPCSVAPGDGIELRLYLEGEGDPVWHWSGRVRRAAGDIPFRHSSRQRLGGADA